MQDFLKIFSFNFISDIDNMIILGAILRKHSYLNITIPAAIVLTLTRTTYIIVISELSNLPLVHLLSGMILLFIAFQLAKTSAKDERIPKRSTYSMIYKIKVLLLLAATDFLICLDGVLVISKISQHITPISIAIFCSLIISLYFLPLIIKVATNLSWINIVIGGFIAQQAVLSIGNDPWLANWINTISPEINIVTMSANIIVIVIVAIGIFSYMNERRIIKLR